MRILPVIDMLRGVVVRGVAGRREEYRPLVSRWTDSTDPVAVAEALRDAFGFHRFYVADLDGILSAQPNRNVYRRLIDAGFDLLIDAGAGEVTAAAAILECGAAAIIGLETLRSPETLGEMIRKFGAERIVFSLDLRSGVPNTASLADWPTQIPSALEGEGGRRPDEGEFTDSVCTLHTFRVDDIPLTPGPSPTRGEGRKTAEAIAASAIGLGVRRMIVLDLADVGTGTGGSTAALCRNILADHPHVTLIAGGGVRGPDDVRRWAETGISELLVASALHDGRLDVAHVS
jgi:phosphoribosylformimino-5-aminoimidazole carboxamide ribotide isomerase